MGKHKKDSITSADADFRLEKVAELRSKLGDELLQKTPLHNDENSLLRWLIAWNWNIDQIVPLFERASGVFESMGLNEFSIDDIDELNEYCTNLSETTKYFPGGIFGYDKEGNVIAIHCVGKGHPKVLSKSARISEIYKLVITETALVYKLLKRQEAKMQTKLGVCIISDLEGFTTDHITAFGFKVQTFLINALQALFPDIMQQIYIVNAPKLFVTAYNMIKHVLPEQTRSKVVFLDHSYREVLNEKLGPENLPSHWGGTKQIVRGDLKFGTLRMGGLPPSSIREGVLMHCQEIESKGLKELTVPAGQKREVEVSVSTEGAKIEWYFVTNSDIEFSITRSDGIVVWPQFRLITDYIPEFGSVECSSVGDYRIVFDNSFSSFFSKHVKYRIETKH